MKLSKSEICFLKFVSTVAIIQGLLWAGLSLGCIILYNSSHDLDTPVKYTDTLVYELYYRFLKELNGNPRNYVIRPTDFTAFMWVYFLTSSIWAAISVDQYFAVQSNKRRMSIVMSLWSVVVIAFSIVDVILMSLLSRDYTNCKDITAETFCFLVNGIGFTLAARGFLLWILNVISAFVTLSYGVKLHRANYMSNAIRIPRAHLAPPINNSIVWGNSSPTSLHPANVTESPRGYLRRDISQTQPYDQRINGY